MEEANRVLTFLRNYPLFLRYWIGVWLSEIGDAIRNMTLLYLVLKLSDRSAVAVSINMFCEYAPVFLFGSLVGVFVDRWDRKRTMLLANLFRAVMVLYFVLAYFLQSLILIYIGAFLCSIGMLFFRAPSPGFITLLIRDKQARRMASSLRQVSISSMMLIGPPLGTALYVYIGGSWSLVMNGVLYVLSTLLIASIPLQHPASDQHKAAPATLASVGREMQDGFRYSWQNPFIRPVLVSCLFLGFGAGLFQVMNVFIITDFLRLPETMLGTVVAFEGFASLVGAFLSSSVKLSGDKLLSWGLLLFGVGLGCTVAFKSLIALCLFTVLFSFGQIAINFGVAVLMQTAVDFAYQGRTGMTINTIMVGSSTLGMILSGWFHNLFTVRPVVAGGGVLILLSALICFWMFQPAVKNESGTQSVAN
jgi:MFS transporter, DHA3 family, macrolide efflux protein